MSSLGIVVIVKRLPQLIIGNPPHLPLWISPRPAYAVLQKEIKAMRNLV